VRFRDEEIQMWKSPITMDQLQKHQLSNSEKNTDELSIMEDAIRAYLTRIDKVSINVIFR
jgi:hypothetical protein